MSIQKRYLKSRPVCKVTFSLPREAVKSAKSVSIVGEFNQWDSSTNPLRKQKDGSFTTTLDLEKGREYQYRYLLDGLVWENDWKADRYVPSGIDACEKSVVVV
jgi:1,4-alpha-glucan branching enzyme